MFIEGDYVCMYDLENRITGHFGIQRDITGRKIADVKIAKSLEEKELLLRELYHRTKNNMQVISSILSIQSGYTNNDEVKEKLEETKSRILGMALVHEKLYQANDLSWIDLKDYITDLVELLKGSLLSKTSCPDAVDMLAKKISSLAKSVITQNRLDSLIPKSTVDEQEAQAMELIKKHRL